LFVLLTLLGCADDPGDCDAAQGSGIALYVDNDGDGFGQGPATWACQVSDGFSELPGDCDDADPQLHPNADELCDGIDNDCSGDVDEDPLDPGQWYPDFDGDGFGDGTQGLSACSAPANYIADALDCDDTRSAVNPSATEVCNGLDDNCDGNLDDESASDALTWFADSDGDGFGDAETSQLHCTQPTGTSANEMDCDDADPSIHPDQEELCDGVDNDCDGAVDFDYWLPGDFSTLDKVIRDAPDGAHICIEPGVYAGGSYSTEKSVHLHGSGVNETVITGGEGTFIASDAPLAFGVYDLELKALGCGSEERAFGALAHLKSGSEVVLERVRIQDASCQATISSYAGLVSITNGSLQTRDVEVDGFSFETESNAHWTALFSGQYADFDIQGLSITNSQIIGPETLYALAFYQDYGTLQVSDLIVRGNTLSAERYAGGVFYAWETTGAHHFENIQVTDNSIETEDFNGTLGPYMRATLGSSTLHGLKIQDNLVQTGSAEVKGLAGYAEQGVHDWQNVLVTGNEVQASSGVLDAGLIALSYANLTLSNVDFSENSFTGLSIGNGGLLSCDFGVVDVRNTTVSKVAFGGAEFRAFLFVESGLLTQGYNNLFESPSPSNWAHVAGDTRMLPSMTVDPLYTDPSSGDFSLSSGSPLIDAGDPDILDADGSVSDVGAYGGPSGASW
jgi:hypothetical protein